ncbi:hypothetical protein [Streptomyces olivaceus]|uniref:hypothetical protein n=1 Tax=Streptomyces olivaceus TaxID=47716 RepID=UPI00363C7D7B
MAAWAYSELSKEASDRGGPLALRYFHRGQGAIIGAAVTGAAIAGTMAYDRWSKRRTSQTTTATPTPGDAPEPEHS